MSEITNNIILNLGNKHFESVIRIDSNKNNVDIIPSFYDENDIIEMLKFSISNTDCDITKELYRKELFVDLIKYLSHFIKKIYATMSKDYIFKILIVFLFHRLNSRQINEDTVFSFTNSKNADKQLEKDLIYQLQSLNKIGLPKDIKLIKDECNKIFRDKSSLLINSNYIANGNIIKEENQFIYEYNLKDYEDDTLETIQIKIPIYQHVIPNLNSLSNEMIRNYICAYIRYSYLNLNTLALAFDYENNILTKNLDKNTTLEAFGSLFNKYYNNWCSAFPDIESNFGSKGSFFNLKLEDILSYQNVVINPPYDETYIKDTFNIIKECLKLKDENVKYNTRFIIIVSDWEDHPSIIDFKEKYKFQLYKKGELDFIDYFYPEKKIIKPCEIVIFDI